MAVHMVQIADVPQSAEASVELARRVEALARQDELLAQRPAALEEKLAEPR